MRLTGRTAYGQPSLPFAQHDNVESLDRRIGQRDALGAADDAVDDEGIRLVEPENDPGLARGDAPEDGAGDFAGLGRAGEEDIDRAARDRDRLVPAEELQDAGGDG